MELFLYDELRAVLTLTTQTMGGQSFISVSDVWGAERMGNNEPADKDGKTEVALSQCRLFSLFCFVLNLILISRVELTEKRERKQKQLHPQINLICCSVVYLLRLL